MQDPNAANNDAELKGQYAFLFQGFDDATKSQFATVGSFRADGNGNITAGIEDVNGPGGYGPAVHFTGKYNAGSDNRGSMTFTDSSGNSATFALALGSLDPNGAVTKASIIEFDDTSGTTGRRGSGSISLQDTQVLDLSNIVGPYAFQMLGQADKPGTRAVITGAYTVDENGNVSNGDEDVNNSGSVAHLSFTGKLSNTADTGSFGRLTLPITSGSGTSNFVVYIVDAKHLLAMTTDQESTSGLKSGQMRARNAASFSASSLQGPSTGFSEGISWLTAGRWNFDGLGSASYNFISGSANGINYNGQDPQFRSLSYAISSNGRVTTSGLLPSDALVEPVFYLIGKNEGFLMSSDSSAASGYFEPQTGGPFSNASLSGNYLLRTIAPPVEGATVESGELTSSGDGTFSVTVDASDASGVLTAGQEQSSEIIIAPEGLGIDGNFFPDYMYLISPNKAVAIWETWSWPVLTIIEH